MEGGDGYSHSDHGIGNGDGHARNGDGNGSGHDDGLPPNRKRHQRHLLACLGCRKIKTRCLGNEDQVSPCQRCRRLNLECVYERKRRRRADVSSGAASPLPLRPSSRSGGTPGPSTRPPPIAPQRDSQRDPQLPPPPSPHPSAHRPPHPHPLPLPPPHQHHGPGPEFQRLARPDVMSESSVRFSTPSESPSSSAAHSASAVKRTDIREYLDPALPRDVNGGEVEPEHLRARGFEDDGPVEDPITLQLLTVSEAETLLGLYMQHINPMTATLDPYLYTLPYLRQASPILLSAVLSIAAKFFRRPVYRPILAHANAIIDRAVGLGQCDIGLIQSLILLVCWKDPTDASSWVKLGIGIRLGYQLGLHLPRNRPLPHNEFEARKIANAERTWYTLSSFDRLYSDVFSLPPTVTLEEIPDAITWAEETAWLGCGDMRHACSFSSASTYRMWVKYRRNLSTMSQDLAWAILTDLYAQIGQHMKRWFPPDPAMGKITQFEQVFLKWFDLNHLLKIKYHMLDICASNERDSVLLDWLHLAEQFTMQTEALGLRGTLRYLQDTSATHVSTFGVMVYNLFSRLPHFQRRVVTGYVKRLSKCCDSATLGDGETVMGFVGRFMQRLQHVLMSSEQPEQHLVGSQQAMPMPPEDPANAGASLDLDDFFRGILQNGQDPFANIIPGQEFWFDPNIVLS